MLSELPEISRVFKSQISVTLDCNASRSEVQSKKFHPPFSSVKVLLPLNRQGFDYSIQLWQLEGATAEQPDGIESAFNVCGGGKWINQNQF